MTYIRRVAKCFNAYFGIQQELRASTFDTLQFLYRVFIEIIYKTT